MDIDEQSETITNESPVSNLDSNNNNNSNEITNGTPIEVDNENSISRQSSTSPPSQQQPLAAIDSNSATPVPIPIKKSKLESNKSTNIDIQQPPIHEIVGGSSIRRYLNEHVTLTLLEGLKELAQVKPEDPLKYLGEYLITKSNETK